MFRFISAWRRRPHIRLTACLIFVFLGAGCGGPLKNFNLISEQEELEMGKQFSQEVEKEVRIYHDAEVAAYINDLGQMLARHSQRPDIPYYIKVVDTDDVNAFALPGGYLYVNRGLISTAESESELAGVMGHEIGHVVGRHGTEQLSKQYGLQIVTSLILGNDPTLSRQIAANIAGIGGTMGLFSYGRDAEREADAFAVQEMYDAGIDPEGMATFFEKLLALHEREPGGLEALFSTHPNTKERIDNVRAQIARLPPKSGLRKDSERFHRIKARLPALKKRGEN